ncbi:MAG: maleylpyruvate isomerase family mycothiol-dependent enzyme [Acidimicrobiales bacterium]
MESLALLATVPGSSAALAAAASAAGLDAPVPSCPGWTAEKLLSHAGSVLRFVGKVVETGGPFDPKTLPRPPVGGLVIQWFEEMATTTVDALAAKAPDDELWNWAGQPPVAAFWHRRMAHELAIHAADAALAAGQEPNIESRLAVNGLDELLTVLLPVKARAGGTDFSGVGTIHVHCTDTGPDDPPGEWLVAPTGTGVEVTRAHARADVALRGPAAQLLLRLSHRGGGGEVLGDDAVLAAFSERFSF